MHVVLVTPIRFLGGGERFLLELAAGLAARRHQVTLIAAPGSAVAESATRRGLPLETTRLGGELDPVAVAALRRILQRRQPQVALVNMEKAVRLTAAARLGMRLPIVRRLGMCLPFPDRLRFRLTYRFLVAHLVVNAQATARVLRARNPWIDRWRVSVIPGAVDTSALAAIDRRAARAALRTWLKIEDDRPIVATVARLEPQKRPEVLIGALAELGADAPHAVWIGHGSLTAAARASAGAAGVRLHLPGFREDAVRMLAGADLLVLPSEAEGMPHAVLEAMALGVPVVASEIDGVVELLDLRRGRLVPVGDAGALAAAIAGTLSDRPAEMERQIDAARQHVRTHHDLRGMIESYEALLEQVAGRA